MSTPPILLCLVDGMRPDALLQANAPTMQAMLRAGAYSLRARSVTPSITLPCITSIFLGVPPQTHETCWNLFNSQNWNAPGLFDALHETGRKTASFYNWEQLRDVSRPGSLDISICLNNAESFDLPLGEGDSILTRLAVSMLASHPVDFAFVYLGCTDTTGHRHGWMSPEYLSTLENADGCIANLKRALPESRMIVVADHGGHETNHGSAEDADMLVPFIAAGSGINPGEIAGPVSLLDIAPSVAALLGLEAPSAWAGRNLFAQ